MGHPTDIFLSIPDNNLICAICHEVLEDASSFKECGHTFCDGCISECLAANPACPTCRKPVHTGSNPNYSLRDIIDKLEVKCPEYEKGCLPPTKRLKTTGDKKDDGADNKSEIGCDWRGTVSELQKHVVEECLLTNIMCSEEGGCKHICQRKDMEAHRSSQQGIMRHMELKYENKLKAMEMKYESKYQMMNDRIIVLENKAKLCFNMQCSLPQREIKRGCLYYCTRCGVANYCSRACQTSDWRNHQLYCDRHVVGRIASQNGSGARTSTRINSPSGREDADFDGFDDDNIDWSAALALTRGEVSTMGGGDEGGSVTSSTHFYGSALNDAIIRVVRRPEYQAEGAVHINNIVLELQGQFSGREVSTAVGHLTNQGHLQNTIDEDHYSYVERREHLNRI
uniref:RING-type domain-containing protein n=1 Tax=Skeletonema marinoi TaxID=267567 RepID=A0A7S0XND2_9STRA|mmetsp:Transcript_628/g.1188  ORF Transcript_628/g.1188 Transcript_628/m.1188 type:complete len:397 (+) Transcript_628:71-1261(+)